MIRILFLLLVSSTCAWAQQRNPLLAPVHNFHVKYQESQAVASLGIPMDGSEIKQMEGVKTYMQCSFLEMSSRPHPSPEQIFESYRSIVNRYGGKMLYRSETFASYQLTRGTKEYWLVVETYGEGKSYSLALLETEAIRIEVSLNQFLSTLEAEGHVPIYINFASGNASLPEGATSVLKRIAQLLTQNPHINLSIEGHTDNVGNASSNKALSEQRAIAVMNALIALGVSPSRLKAVGMGQDQPVADNTTFDGRQRNRRVELVKIQ